MVKRSIKVIGRNLFDSSISSLRTATLWANEVLNNYEDVVWVIGDGRSGTTWIQELLAKSLRFRMMYEPFHPESGASMAALPLNWYVRPLDDDPRMFSLCESVFRGRFFHPNVDSGNSRVCYRGIVVKDIFANLFACWVSEHFPKVKMVMLVRNPFSVALSKREKESWIWMRNGADFLLRRSLVEDHLQRFIEVIRSTDQSFFQQQILIWAIIYRIPFLQDFKCPLYYLFYEDLITDTNYEIEKLLKYLFGEDKRVGRRLSSDFLDRPSRGSEKRGMWVEGLRLLRWKNELDNKDIDAGLMTLERFGLDGLYGDGATPRIASGLTVVPELRRFMGDV